MTATEFKRFYYVITYNSTCNFIATKYRFYFQESLLLCFLTLKPFIVKLVFTTRQRFITSSYKQERNPIRKIRQCRSKFRQLQRRRKRGAAPLPPPPQLIEGGATYPLAPDNPPIFSFNFYVKQEKNHKCTKLKGKIIINVTLI